MQLLHSTSAGFFRPGVLMYRYLQQTMHSPQSRSATSEKYFSAPEKDGMSGISFERNDINEMGRYQQQFHASRITLSDKRDMADGTGNP
jgi:hypothetical protein